MNLFIEKIHYTFDSTTVKKTYEPIPYRKFYQSEKIDFFVLSFQSRQ